VRSKNCSSAAASSAVEVRPYAGRMYVGGAAGRVVIYGGVSCRPYSDRLEQLTFIARRSSSTSAGRAGLRSGAAGKPTYLATPDKMDTSRLYAAWLRI